MSALVEIEGTLIKGAGMMMLSSVFFAVMSALVRGVDGVNSYTMWSA